MQKILVSGAGGFVGARVMQQWQGRFELCAFPKGMLAHAAEEDVLTFVSAQKPDGIVHLAALSDTGYCEQNPDASFRANVQLPLWLAHAAQANGAKLVAFSSDQVYAGVLQQGALPETLPLHPVNVYGRHKLEAEQRVRAFLPEAVFLRASWMYDLPGYGLPVRANLPLNLVRAALRGENMRFSCRDFRGVTYVRQAVENLTAALALPGGIYNFGSENTHDMAETARCFAQAFGMQAAINTDDWPRNLAMDCTKLRQYGIIFDDTQAGIERCLRDYGLK